MSFRPLSITAFIVSNCASRALPVANLIFFAAAFPFAFGFGFGCLVIASLPPRKSNESWHCLGAQHVACLSTRQLATRICWVKAFAARFNLLPSWSSASSLKFDALRLDRLPVCRACNLGMDNTTCIEMGGMGGTVFTTATPGRLCYCVFSNSSCHGIAIETPTHRM